MAILVDELREYPDVGAPVHDVVPHDDGRGVRRAARVRGAARAAARVVPARPLRPAAARPGGGASRSARRRSATGELLLRMTGPRGDRARRRALAPGGGVTWLRGRRRARPCCAIRPGALVVIGGPPGAGKSTLAARVVDRDARAGARPGRRSARRSGGSWEEALAAWRDELRAALAAGGGAVAVTTALRHGHRLGHGEGGRGGRRARRTCVLLDADAEACRAGRAAQGAARIADGLFEHLLREWAAFRRRAGRRAADPAPFDSVTILDRAAAAIASAGSTISPSGRGLDTRAGEGTRTPDLRFTRAVLYQLSYSGRRRTSLGPRARAPIHHGAMKRVHPTTPLWVKLTALAAAGRACAGWWLADRQRPRGNERRLSAIASQIAGRAVERPLPRADRARVRLGHRRGQRALRRRRRRRTTRRRSASSRAPSSTRSPRAGARKELACIGRTGDRVRARTAARP